MENRMSAQEYQRELLDLQQDYLEALREGDNFKAMAIQSKRHALTKRYRAQNPVARTDSNDFSRNDYVGARFFLITGLIILCGCLLVWLIAASVGY